MYKRKKERKMKMKSKAKLKIRKEDILKALTIGKEIKRNKKNYFL